MVTQVPDQHLNHYTVVHRYYLTSPTKLYEQILLTPSIMRKRQRGKRSSRCWLSNVPPLPLCQESLSLLNFYLELTWYGYTYNLPQEGLEKCNKAKAGHPASCYVAEEKVYSS